MESEHKYIYFPLHLISNIHLNPNNTINDILDYGIGGFSTKFEYRSIVEEVGTEMHYVYRQVIYSYYNNSLAFGIKEWVDELVQCGDLILDEDFRGFDALGIEFEAYEQIEALDIAWQDDQHKKDVCIRFYQMRLAMKNLGLTGTLSSIWKNYTVVFNRSEAHQAKYGGDAMVSIKKDLIMDFYKNVKSKEEYHLFAAYCAVKSIIGNKQYAGTNKPFIKTRMMGAKNHVTLDRIFNDLRGDKRNNEKCELEKVFEGIKRYHLDKILDQLVDRGFLKSKIGEKGARMFYISTSLSHTDLAIEICQKPSSKVKREANKKKEQDAIMLLKQLRQHNGNLNAPT